MRSFHPLISFALAFIFSQFLTFCKCRTELVTVGLDGFWSVIPSLLCKKVIALQQQDCVYFSPDNEYQCSEYVLQL